MDFTQENFEALAAENAQLKNKVADLEKFKADHTEPDTDEQVRAYLDRQAQKESARKARAERLKATFK